MATLASVRSQRLISKKATLQARKRQSKSPLFCGKTPFTLEVNHQAHKMRIQKMKSFTTPDPPNKQRIKEQSTADSVMQLSQEKRTNEQGSLTSLENQIAGLQDEHIILKKIDSTPVEMTQNNQNWEELMKLVQEKKPQRHHLPHKQINKIYVEQLEAQINYFRFIYRLQEGIRIHIGHYQRAKELHSKLLTLTAYKMKEISELKYLEGPF